ncbi:hypothetical protein BVRB_023490 [Beta vulgaris subsp. vulgaris]|uniref:Uncharacterized protein n=1 Tax=Beta vulgaris subsp. vulgaris TaxID=3555 RepID=A0A0J8AZT6_BETVV|nr:hypothetical protein BVRB_023490 [Beta vulgaris subsp. vulgaris]
MSRVFADITQKHRGEIAETDSTASSPKLRRLNVASRKISREIRIAVLAHDAVALRAALKAAEELDMDSHLIKAARASLVDMESNVNDENLAPGYDANIGVKEVLIATAPEEKTIKTKPGENNVDSLSEKLPESSSKTSFESNSDSDGFFRTNDFENLKSPEGEKDLLPNEPIAYSVNFPPHPLFEDKKNVALINRVIEENLTKKA